MNKRGCDIWHQYDTAYYAQTSMLLQFPHWMLTKICQMNFHLIWARSGTISSAWLSLHVCCMWCLWCLNYLVVWRTPSSAAASLLRKTDTTGIRWKLPWCRSVNRYEYPAWSSHTNVKWRIIVHVGGRTCVMCYCEKACASDQNGITQRGRLVDGFCRIKILLRRPAGPVWWYLIVNRVHVQQ